MEIFWDLKGVKRNQNSVLTVGTFDGVHLGHQFILAELKKRAGRYGAQTTLVTFRPHPQLVLKSSIKPNLKLLTTVEEKIDILKDLDIDRVVVIQFTKEFSNTPSNEFVQNILFNAIGFSEIVIGHDHAFGKNRAGNIKTLKMLGEELGFTVDELPAYTVDGTVISSTRIRDLLKEGKIKEANKLLGRNYFFSGKVVKGDGRGKILQFPTANLKPTSEDKLLPKDGVYAVFVYFGGNKYKGMMNIGVRPTFETIQHTIEIHILDFNQDIYNEVMKVEFVDRIRNEIYFSNSDELVNQLENDRIRSLGILENN
jgi:riboflavin kinase/FMN adenylyltransferase